MQGFYTPKNPDKYVGTGKIIYRSSWELAFMTFCDTNEHILEWASEAIRIPYRNPITGKQTTYVPDFFVRYRDKNNQIITELVEVKPLDQAFLREGMNANQRATVAVNQAKWAMARAWCQRNGIRFRIASKDDIFVSSGRKR